MQFSSNFCVLVALLSTGCVEGAFNVWFDGSCNREGVQEAFQEAIQFSKKGYERLSREDGDPNVQNYWKWLFKGGADEKTTVLRRLQEHSETVILPGKDGADLFFYCDDDARWVVAPDDVVAGNSKRRTVAKAFYDQDNEMVYDLKKFSPKNRPLPPHDRPGCLANRENPDQRSHGETYSTRKDASFGELTVITLCNEKVEQRPNKVGDIKGNLADAGIDSYSLLSMTINHELWHDSNWNLEDVNGGDSYGWANSVGMTSADALGNADTYALFGLACFLEEYTVLEDGTVTYVEPSDDEVGDPERRRKRSLPAKCRNSRSRRTDKDCVLV